MNNWIDVNDRLPEKSVSVLVSDGSNIGYCNINYFGDWVVSGQNILAHPLPTHWQPLPEPPTQKDSE